MNANYATEAGSAKTAVSARHATEADHAQKATDSERATNSNYAIISKEAERLNCGGNIIHIISESGYVIFMPPGANASECVMLDLKNRSFYNVAQIARPDGTVFL
jgi:hypothetical protein